MQIGFYWFLKVSFFSCLNTNSLKKQWKTNLDLTGLRFDRHFKASEKVRLKGRGINPYFLMSFKLLLRILGNIAGDMECGINTSSCKFTFLLM